MFSRRDKIHIEAERISLRLPEMADHQAWCTARRHSQQFLEPWEPLWGAEHFARKSFSNRVYWAKRNTAAGLALPLFIFNRADQSLLGAITLDNICRGAAQSAIFGYWISKAFARQGYMSEAIRAVTHYAFTNLDLSRIQAACLPENQPSRGLLEKNGFKYEGVAQSYLQISGRWRTHVIYAILRHDRRGKSDAH